MREVDYWAFCSSCMRWYYLPRGGSTGRGPHTCPVCHSRPDRVIAGGASRRK